VLSPDEVKRVLTMATSLKARAMLTLAYGCGLRASEVVRLRAWDEAAAACSDMIRDTIARLGDSPEWRLEVADESGTIRHLFRLTAETFDP